MLLPYLPGPYDRKAVALSFMMQVPGVVGLLRNRAIDNSAPMSADIEGYRERNRHYPISLQSSLGDWDRRVMGIDRYRYEPSGAAYNLFFELPSNEIGTQEFVVYNPLDEQQMSAHDADRLQLSVEDQNRMRGYHATRDAGRPHWKSFYFD